jgi:hypothetical protein
VAGGDPAPLLELVDQVLDPVALAIGSLGEPAASSLFGPADEARRLLVAGG